MLPAGPFQATCGWTASTSARWRLRPVGQREPPAPSVFACGRTKRTVPIAIVTLIIFTWLQHFEGKGIIADLKLEPLDLVGLGARAPGAAVTPRQRGPPPSRTSGRGEVAKLAGG